MYSVLRRLFCSVDLSIGLLLCLSLTLLAGGIETKLHPAVFGQLNFQTFQEWLPSHGLASSWWLWLLFVLLTLFAANTAACMMERLLELAKNRRKQPFASFVLQISPSVMHLCFLAVIGGHAISQFAAESLELPAHPSATLHLQSGVLQVVDSRCAAYHGKAGLAGLAKTCTANLSFFTENGAAAQRVSLLQPIFLDGYSVHLVMAGKSEFDKAPKLKLVFRKDPGLGLILLGNLILCLLMIWYFPVIIRNGT